MKTRESASSGAAAGAVEREDGSWHVMETDGSGIQRLAQVAQILSESDAAIRNVNCGDVSHHRIGLTPGRPG